jgi:putative tryptophan/tyrosine transport system substrate-binding protein
MRRRDFIWLLGYGVAASWPIPVWAQQAGKVYRIDTVSPSTPVSDINEADPIYGPFLGELRRLGYLEGLNLVIERFSAEGHLERYREIVSEVVRATPDAVFVFQAQLTLELKTQTTTIPVVGASGDPVGAGIVPSLARPGGNITGVDGDGGMEAWGKRLGLLKELVPRLSCLGLLAPPTLQGQRGAVMLKEASNKIGVSVIGSSLATPLDETAYRRAFAAMVQDGAEAVFVGNQNENLANRRLIVELCGEHRLPAIYASDTFVQIGGLLAYSPDWTEVIRHAAGQIDQILKGVKPGDIPFYQARKFLLPINLKTAQALGIEISPNLLAQADEVIE